MIHIQKKSLDTHAEHWLSIINKLSLIWAGYLAQQ